MRPDAENEIIRCRNAMDRIGARQVLLGGLSPSADKALGAGWNNCMISHKYVDHAQALRGRVRHPKGILRWGPNNLGIGLYQARLKHQELQTDLDVSPSLKVMEAGTHLLIACEQGDMLAEVIASNIAFACKASFAVFEELDTSDREFWLEEIYALGEGGDLTGRFNKQVQQARAHLGELDFARYKSVLFITAGFPWGIATPQVASTHMYRYPDFGRSVADGIWASQEASRSARNALLIDPQAVESSEIPAINQVLLKNGTLTHIVRGPAATQTKIQYILDLVPHDIVVISSHAGDAPGERITYEYSDDDDRKRTLVVDQALGIGHDLSDDMFRVIEYHRFRSLDGVDWRDKEKLASLPVGTAVTSWSAMSNSERNHHIVSKQTIPRVTGSMAIKLFDGIWLFVSHGFPPESAPIFINNSCWSWHELSLRTTFAGARAYIGTLFPITDAEAQEVGQALFGRYIGQELTRALWSAQRKIYGTSARRPYVMVGLPFIAIRPNTKDVVSYLIKSYLKGIEQWRDKADSSPNKDVRKNAERFWRFLEGDLENFRNNLRLGRKPHR